MLAGHPHRRAGRAPLARSVPAIMQTSSLGASLKTSRAVQTGQRQATRSLPLLHPMFSSSPTLIEQDLQMSCRLVPAASMLATTAAFTVSCKAYLPAASPQSSGKLCMGSARCLQKSDSRLPLARKVSQFVKILQRPDNKFL